MPGFVFITAGPSDKTSLSKTHPMNTIIVLRLINFEIISTPEETLRRQSTLDLLRKMIRYDPAKRININEVGDHAWIKNLPKLSVTSHILTQLTPERALTGLAIISAALIVYATRLKPP